MKKVSVLALAFVLSMGVMSAQTKEAKGNRGDKKDRTEMLTKTLELTPEQQAKVKALNESNSKEAKTDMKAKQEARNKEMKEILTPDQYVKYEKMQADRKSQMKQERKGDKATKK